MALVRVTLRQELVPETGEPFEVQVELPAKYAEKADQILAKAGEDLLELCAEVAGKIPVALGLKQLET